MDYRNGRVFFEHYQGADDAVGADHSWTEVEEAGSTSGRAESLVADKWVEVPQDHLIHHPISLSSPL